MYAIIYIKLHFDRFVAPKLTFHNGLIYAGQSPSDGKVISQMTSQKESQACDWRNS